APAGAFLEFPDQITVTSRWSPFVVSRSVFRRDLVSFPTRRSSDLLTGAARVETECGARRGVIGEGHCARLFQAETFDPAFEQPRSEEHTSELQSLTNLVCRLLLEKKK